VLDAVGSRELAVGLSHGDLNDGLMDGFSTDFGPMFPQQVEARYELFYRNDESSIASALHGTMLSPSAGHQ
jgi:hypothetical protein